MLKIHDGIHRYSAIDPIVWTADRDSVQATRLQVPHPATPSAIARTEDTIEATRST